ncbi:hypothetical protein GOV03_00960 [Candidatus Woesearchaeota archaeon]|nr:hypothetical protein [Candidatus Woesearchaeota archaeon]
MTYFEKNEENKHTEREHKPLTHEHIRKPNHKVKKAGIWKISTAILGILLLISVFAGNFSGTKSAGLTGNAVASDTIKYINENLLQGQGVAELKDVAESNGVYKLKLDVSGQEMESYVSSDGKLFFPQAMDLTTKPQIPTNTQQAPSDVPKSSKPEVELFVMSHCPYGTQMEKGILPVVKELGNKIDFELKFVNYAMHPTQGEVEEQLNQYCIQKEFPDKFTAYLGKFLEAGDGEEAFSVVGLSEADISQCVKETDKKYSVLKNLNDKSSWSGGRFPPFLIHDADNKKYGVQGSPTLIINGQKAESGRDAQSILKAICGAFTDKPKECSTDMTSFGNPGPGFGFDTQGGSATSAGCGA